MGTSLEYTNMQTELLKSEIIMLFLELWVLLLGTEVYSCFRKGTCIESKKYQSFLWRILQVKTNRELVLLQASWQIRPQLPFLSLWSSAPAGARNIIIIYVQLSFWGFRELSCLRIWIFCSGTQTFCWT